MLGLIHAGARGVGSFAVQFAKLWWPDRRGLDSQTEEFEAEAYLVCGRLGIDNPSPLPQWAEKVNDAHPYDERLQSRLQSHREFPGCRS
jgi:NADPH:quinone reductase-like Zn-dependent oxidoreductase